jgi:hypothetical protein
MLTGHPWLTQHPEWFKCRPDGGIIAGIFNVGLLLGCNVGFPEPVRGGPG